MDREQLWHLSSAVGAYISVLNNAQASSLSQFATITIIEQFNRLLERARALLPEFTEILPNPLSLDAQGAVSTQIRYLDLHMIAGQLYKVVQRSLPAGGKLT